MHELSIKYNESFKPNNTAMEQTYLEGVENCVTKNLYQVLFGEGGIGNKQTPPGQQKPDPNVPVDTKVPLAHREEMEYNAKISANIQRFGSFVEPRHLEIDESRLI